MTALLHEKVLIPDLLETAPQVRPVLDRYGLRGCGGPKGPRETLGFFAKAHDVPIQRLLEELRAGMEQPTGEDAVVHKADAIYRPFFRAGIAVVLTLGAAWGAYLLWRIGMEGSFAAAGIHEINAHGHAQIFGWVGLFVMGFAYQAFPRFKHADLAYSGLAFASLWLMLAGLVGRSLGQPLAGVLGWAWLPAVGGSVLEIIAIVLFAWVIAATWRRSGKPLAGYDYYIGCALFWFVVQAIYESAYLIATLNAADTEKLIDLVATWQGPLREIQIHGFALFMILGVSQRLFPHMYGFPTPHSRTSWRALLLLNAAVLGEVAGMILMRTQGHAWAILTYLSILWLAGAVISLVRDWRIFSAAPESDRSLKFLRTAYAWLLVSLGMLVLVPLHKFVLVPLWAPDSNAAEIGFSHAYYGAIRHAITVGFVSLMIVGVAAKVVPTLNGVDVRALSSLWGPFVLINAGCALRVSGQTLTDFAPASFPVTALSGILEVLGLGWWGLHLWRIMAGRIQNKASSIPVVAGAPIIADNLVGEVLDVYPEVLPLFLSFGFKPLAYSLFRKTIAYRVTLASACRLLGVTLPEFLETLNRQRHLPKDGRLALPICDN
jgi:hypothetical protein